MSVAVGESIGPRAVVALLVIAVVGAGAPAWPDTAPARAQSDAPPTSRRTSLERVLVDAPGEPGLAGRMMAPDSARRSPWVALTLSAGVPGAGQVYNDDWIKAGVAVALEAALWSGWAVWRSRGRSGRRAYRSYAHEHFDPVRYARWLNEYPGYRGDPIPVEEVSGSVDFSRPESWTSAERRAVQRLIDAIQAAENEAHFAGDPSASFSHQLPDFGDQQYYELIGKYHQYAAGWDDCGSGCGVDGPSSRFRRYARMHGEANTQLRRASRASALILVNHGLAALDGLLSAQLHNSRIDTRARLLPGPRGRLRTRLAIRYRW